MFRIYIQNTMYLRTLFISQLLFLRLETQDLIVLNPRWLCVDVIGHMLSQEHLETANITGTYTMDDIQQQFPDTDALDLLQVNNA